MRALPILILVVTACGNGGGGTGGDDTAMPDAAPIDPVANPAREIVDTKLTFDVSAKTATAVITFAPSDQPGASLEVGDLTINSVSVKHVVNGEQLDLGLPASTDPLEVTFTYGWNYHEEFDGASSKGFTFLWPYFCKNLFPCHSAPTDGTTFTLDVTGVPADKKAVFPTTIPGEAPSYQMAWSIDSYTELELGTTEAGTKLSVWYLPGEATKAATATTNLVAAFNWFEKTLGPYRFGNKAGSVSVAWGAGAYGGMEHHPYWHVGGLSFGSQEVHIHESAHGWFGDGIRIGCWEDFVLSEGTTSYLAARALDVVAPTIGAATWQDYQTDLGKLNATQKVWPQGCGMIDVIGDGLYTNAPYMRGAFFYRALAQRLSANGADGAHKVDEILAAFYQAHGGKAATMNDMLATIQSVSGYDATACANTWLKEAAVPTPGACP